MDDNSLQAIKLPPHSLEAEQAVLGGLLLENDAMDRVVDLIGELDFYRHDHRLIFKQAQALIEQNKPADVVTVFELLEKHGQAIEAGGLAYLSGLVQAVPSAANIRRYAEIVRERSVMRRLVEVGTFISDSAYEPMGRGAEDLLDQAEAKVFEIAEGNARSQQTFLDIGPLLTQVVDKIDTLYNREGDSDVTGIPTGFVDLDNMTSGLQPGDLVIVAGRPSMGKTAFAMNVAEHVALEASKAVAVFSMEMGAVQLLMRMIGSVGRLDQHKLKTGKLQDEDWQKLSYAVGRLNDVQLYIDESAGLTVREVRARSRRLARRCNGLGLIVIDYLQLMSGNSRDQNRTAEVSEISRSLKSLAKELQVPVIALSQLNRSLEQRTDKRPMMSDLRESGAIEQDADLILFMYRDEYYNPDSPEKGMAEVIIGKQRNGPTGRVRLTFRGEYSRFENFSQLNESAW